MKNKKPPVDNTVLFYYPNSTIKRFIFGVIFFSVFVVLIIIIFVFPFYTSNKIFQFKENEGVDYWGTCLSAFGTVFLGAVALWQNHIIAE